MKRTSISALRGLLFLACLALPTSAFGQGLILPGAGGMHRSMAGASTAVAVDALGALYWNPATISGLPGSEVVIGGEALMPLDEYPFSKRYGWVQDRYGISWQLMLADPAGDPRPPIVPCLMFAGDAAGQARDAGAFYRSVFDDSLEGQWVPHPAGGEWDREGSTLFSDFRIDRTWMVAMDSAYPHGFGFNEAISFIVHCRDQAELGGVLEQ